MYKGVIVVLFAGLSHLAPQVPAERQSEAQPPASDPGKVPDSIRVADVIARIKAARADIQSYSMRIAYERRNFPETALSDPITAYSVEAYAEGEWMEQGSKWRVHITRRWENPVAPPTASPPGSLRAPKPEYASWEVYNGEYHATTESRTPGRIRLTPQQSIDANRVYAEISLKPLTWGLGYGGGYLDEVYESDLTSSRIDWQSERITTHDGPKIKLIRHRRSNSRDRDVRDEFIVDPDRGYLLVQIEHQQPPGSPEQRTTFELQQWPSGRWFPSRAVERSTIRDTTYTFSEIRFNRSIDDEAFTLESFDLDLSKARLYRKELDNSSTRMLYWGGQWVPEVQVPAHARPTLPGDGIRFPDLGRPRP